MLDEAGERYSKKQERDMRLVIEETFDLNLDKANEDLSNPEVSVQRKIYGIGVVLEDARNSKMAEAA